MAYNISHDTSNLNFNQLTSGYTLIEVLVAMFLLGFMLLAMNCWQFDVLYVAKKQYWQTIALQQLQNMRVEQQAGEMSVADISEWNRQNQLLLPQGHGILTDDQLQLSWQANGGIWYCLLPSDQHHGCLAISL